LTFGGGDGGGDDGAAAAAAAAAVVFSARRRKNIRHADKQATTTSVWQEYSKYLTPAVCSIQLKRERCWRTKTHRESHTPCSRARRRSQLALMR
jgi:hypothetical protein